MNPRAITYRRLHDIPADWGTAVNVQAMVFGNMGDDCATGVCFTRDPSTGENVFYGEYLVNAQGEDVVAGIRTPQPMSKARAKPGEVSHGGRRCRTAYAELLAVRATLEQHYRDMQDIEFTIQQNKLYMLQTRNGKRTAAASLRIAVEMAHEGLIDQKEAVLRVNPAALDQLLHPTLDPEGAAHAARQGPAGQPGRRQRRGGVHRRRGREPRRQGRGGDPGADRDQPRGHPRHARRARHPDHARRHDQPRRGGGARHGPALRRRRRRHRRWTTTRRRCRPAARTVRAGETITLDGATGEVFVGHGRRWSSRRCPAISRTLMDWADASRRLGVRANAETPLDAETARKFGAEGIGLCRTEHMFFDPERIGAVRQMIMARDEAGRRAALAKLLPFQREDFVELFRIMAGLPVTIRLLDPPLHEFLPHAEAELAEVAGGAGHRRRSDAPARGRAGRGQPDAGPSRLPAGDHLSRRSTRCRRARSSRAPSRSPRKAARRRCPRS